MNATRIIIGKRILRALSKKVMNAIKETPKEQMNQQMIIVIKEILTTMTMKTVRTTKPIA